MGRKTESLKPKAKEESKETKKKGKSQKKVTVNSEEKGKTLKPELAEEKFQFVRSN